MRCTAVFLFPRSAFCYVSYTRGYLARDKQEDLTPVDTYTLICILGTGSYQECRYSLEGEVSRPGRYAPLLEIEVLLLRQHMRLRASS